MNWDMDGNDLADRMLSLGSAMGHVPALTLTNEESLLVRNGHQPSAEWLDRLDGQPVSMGKAGFLFRILDSEVRSFGVAPPYMELSAALRCRHQAPNTHYSPGCFLVGFSILSL